jgi:hypothetical protein
MRCAILIVLGLASSAHAAPCSYGVSYNGSNLTNACFIDVTPAGCPIHTLVPRTTEINVMLYRGTAVIPNTATMTNVGMLEQSYLSFDYFSCDCPQSNGTARFDEVEINVPEAQAGDIVSLAGADTEIGPAGPCTAAVWPTQVDISIGGCDRCPDRPDDSGCSAGGSCFGAIFGLLAIIARRRRSTGASRA